VKNLTYAELIAEIDRMNTKQTEAYINSKNKSLPNLELPTNKWRRVGLSTEDQDYLNELNAERIRRGDGWNGGYTRAQFSKWAYRSCKLKDSTK